jgi:hypothetical protein
MRIGVVGWTNPGFDREMAEAHLIATITMQALNLKPGEQIGDRDVTIVSGLTTLGVPGIAYELASKWGCKTIGVACAKAHDHDCHPCDFVHIVGEQWGDESAAFLAAIDVLIRIGGGPQSLAEAARAKELGIRVIERELAGS